MTLRAAVIGLGVGEAHAAAYAAHPACELTALCDLDPARLEAIGAAHPGVRRTTDANDVLDDPSIDVISIASYDDHHADQIVRGLARGARLFCEKPLCLTADDLARIEAVWPDDDTPRLTCNLVLRGHARFQAMRARVAGGSLGALYHADAAYLYGRIHKLHDGWRGAIPTYSVMLGGGIHLIDLLLWISGERVTRVHAAGNRITTERAGVAFAGLDCVTALLEFASGMTATVSANFGCVRPHAHALTLFGTDGTIEHRDGAATIWQTRDASNAPVPLGPSAAEDAAARDKGGLIGAFVEAIRTGQPAPITRREILDAMHVGCAIDEAVRTRRAVDLA